MAKIIPKLNLNKTPHLVEPNSLIYAQNVRFVNDGTLARDYGISKFKVLKDDENLCELKGVIPYNTKIYLFYFNYANNKSFIIEYDEKSETVPNYRKLNCNWNYSGGKITGYVTVNLNSDIILTICEYFDEYVQGRDLVPIKHINLSECSDTDNESFYTQTPDMPIVNLKFQNYYTQVIPRGVYQFFIRYEIKKDFYTSWMPCSKELFVGGSELANTVQGSVKFIDNNTDSNVSFSLGVEKIVNVEGYQNFQIGFILSHDNTSVARSWKKFPIDTEFINFDYDTNYIEEINIDDLLKVNFNLYNVKNIANFKNRLYVSNYIESDLDEDLSSYSEKIKIDIKQSEFSNVTEYINGKKLTIVPSESLKYYTEVDNNPITKEFVKYEGQTSMYNTSVKSNSKQKVIHTENNPDYSFLEDTGKTWLKKKYNDHPWILNKIVIDTDTFAFTDKSFIKKESLQFYSINEIMSKVDAVAGGSGLLAHYKNGVLKTITTDINVHYTIYGYTITRKAKDPSLDITEKSTRASIQTNEYVLTEYENTVTDKLTIKFNVDSITLSYETAGSTSLIPFKGYKFYANYVRKNGEISSGNYIGSIDVTPDLFEKDGNIVFNDKSIIYPSFSNIEIPVGYVACFISIFAYKNKVAQLFNFEITKHNSNLYADCLDIDSRLLPLNSNIKAYVFDTGEVLSNGQYVNSGYYDPNDTNAFGCSGKVRFKEHFGKLDSYFNEHKVFIVVENSKNEDNVVLTKCTPYITAESGKTVSFDDPLNLNLLSYICNVVKPASNFDSYISSTDAYTKNDGELVDNNEKVGIISTAPVSIYSEFNLNYLSLTDEVSSPIRIYGPEGGKRKQLFPHFESLILSSVYKLNSEYYDYVKKTFTYRNKYAITEFNNTIRSSNINQDESKSYIYTFDNTRYYNVPTNKDIITNLISVGNIILVHTKDSLFTFSGHNSINSENGEVSLNESDIFDTGIIEVFGSEHGYAGLETNEHSIVTPKAYVFFDSDTKKIYSYSGQGQLICISDSISKLFETDINKVIFADDSNNDRIFICINDEVTISYNYKAQAFISIHPFRFDSSFSTKINCYFIWDSFDDYIYRVNKNVSSLAIPKLDTSILPILYDGDKSVIDIIFNRDYDKIKILNSIRWISKNIISYFSEYDKTGSIEKSFMAEENYIPYPGNYMLIYTDSCYSKNIDLSVKCNTLSGSESVPYYDNGAWNFNYFRDISKLQIDEETFKPDISDNKSLIYGKYFVIRFVFDNNRNFKLDDLTFNYSVYE